MYRVNVTPADSFNDPGGGLNYEHDEEHDKVDHLRYGASNTEIFNSISTEAFNKLNLSTENRKSLIQKIQDLCIIYSHGQIRIQLNIFIDEYEKLENKRGGKDKRDWAKKVIKYCKDAKINIGPNPKHARKNANKENAKAHHLNHFSVVEHTDKKGHSVLTISTKPKHHHRHQQQPTTVPPGHHKTNTVTSGHPHVSASARVHIPDSLTHEVPKYSPDTTPPGPV
jgi:hypothetical protein